MALAAPTVDADIQDPARNLTRYRLGFTALFLGIHLLTHFTQGLRWEHYAVNGLFLWFTWGGPKRREFALLALPLWGVGFVYDNARFIEQLHLMTVHVDDLFWAEVKWFGTMLDGERVPWAWFFDKHNHPFLDLLTGFAYIVYLFEPILLAIGLYFYSKPRMRRLAWGWFVVNLIGVCTYVLYPAAPPWYVAAYGLGPADMNALPEAAGAARFDELLGINYFRSFYDRNATVFGAMPSLHAAYPVVVALAMLGINWWVTTLVVGFAGLVAFAAVYLGHHYIWDVIVGIAYALISVAVVMWVTNRGRRPRTLRGWWQVLRFRLPEAHG